ncbi:MAG: hypothetical protein KC589_00740, partial [Nanoarchaeota archaeon]|nr:hypothetical protein [Nanoarchaeota archaeon]
MLGGFIESLFKKKGNELERINENLIYILAINSWDALKTTLDKKKNILDYEILKKDKNLKSLLKKVFSYFKNKSKNDFTVSELRKFRENVELAITYIETNYYDS